MNLTYNPKDKKSVINYAKLLIGKNLKQVCDPVILKHNYSGKGNFGQILEKYYFVYDPNSKSEADFIEIGLELKSSPLKQLKNNEYRSKERLVLNIINYTEVVKQNFEESDFWKKNSNLLLVFYLYKTESNILEYIIKLVDEWNFPDSDLEIIKNDWNFIKQKINIGKAHELSEGDTFYLGACTKGANANTQREQPFSDKKAKQRAYSLKQGYVNHIIASIASEPTEKYGKIIPNVSNVSNQTLDEIVIEKFKTYYGKTIEQILESIGVQINIKAKNFFALLTKAILGIELDKEIEEFQKADIIVKSIRVESNNKIVESVSFKHFSFIDLVDNTWENSEFKKDLESKYLFIFFKLDNNTRILQKAKFWNMPYLDILEAKKVWSNTKKIVKDGRIVKKIMPNGTRKTNFYGKNMNKVSHVRPHAANADDTYPLPTKDELTQSMVYTKHCFWLNNDYIKNEIYLK